MSEDQSGVSSGGWSTLLLFGLLAGFAILNREPISSLRPEAESLEARTERGVSSVYAHPWADPIEAAHAGVEQRLVLPLGALLEPETFNEQGAVDPGSAKNPLVLPTNRLRGVVDDRKDESVLVALLPDDLGPEAPEQRRRIRQAVHYALAEEGYRPDESASLRYVSIQAKEAKGQGTDNDKSPPPEFRIPYEHFRRHGAPAEEQFQRITVVWLLEPTDSAKTLKYVSWLTAGIEKSAIKILGPSSSGRLLAMMQEFRKGEWAITGSGDQAWELLNYRATATEKRLLEDARVARPHRDQEGESEDQPPMAGWSRVDTVEEWFQVLGNEGPHTISYGSVVAEDHDAVQAIVDEIDLHTLGDVDPSEVLVVSEAGSVYGESLFLDLNGAFPDGSDKPKHARYLRVLDVGGNTSDAGGQFGGGAESLHPPIGQDQYDYLRREARSIAGHGLGQGNIRFVVLLGTDVYDKLISLQAIRAELQHATFLTTDLDARLLHSSQYEWARNLIVVSPFGLELSSRWQGAAPSFRDSYQTAAFAATRVLAGNKRIAAKLRDNRTCGSTLRFEVARSGAWELGMAERGEDDLHPPSPASVKGLSWRLFPIGLLAFVALLSYAVIGGPRRACGGVGQLLETAAEARGADGPTPFWARLLRPALYIVSILYAGWIFAAILKVPTYEPFAVLEGISVWPTQGVRLLALIFLIVSSAAIARESAGWSVERMFASSRNRAARDERAVGLLRQYSEERAASRVVRRTAPLGLLLLGLYLWAELQIGEQRAPIRGDVTRVIDYVTSSTVVVLLMAQLLYVHDATMRLGDLLGSLVTARAQLRPDGDEVRALGVADPEAGLCGLVDFAARRTRVVGKTILAPAVALLLLIVSRSHLFDAWQWPTWLVGLIAFGMLIVIAAAIRLRRSAEALRAHVLDELRVRKSEGALAPASRISTPVEVQLAIDRVTLESRGAFSPWFRNPVVYAALVPISGPGGLIILEMLAAGAGG